MEAAGAVSQCLPQFNLPAKELGRHPKLCRLLLLLTDRLDGTGLSLTLKRDLEKGRGLSRHLVPEKVVVSCLLNRCSPWAVAAPTEPSGRLIDDPAIKASGELRARRRQWLTAEALERTVEELVAERHAARAEEALRPADRQFVDTLERCWVLARCRRGLDAREGLSDAPPPPLLGLGREQLDQLLPGTKEVLAMRRRLVMEVEQRLVTQCVELLTYVWPQCDGEGPSLVLTRGGELADWIQAQGVRVDKLREQGRQNQAAVSRQRLACLTVLSRCSELLWTLTETHRLGSQSQLDRSLQEYLRVKSRALFTKLRLLRLDLQHKTFDREVVGAHCAIRELLQEALSREEAALRTLRGQLDLFRLLGPEFEGLVQEYGRLLALLDNKRWALQEFSGNQAPGGEGGGWGTGQ